MIRSVIVVAAMVAVSAQAQDAATFEPICRDMNTTARQMGCLSYFKDARKFIRARIVERIGRAN